MAARIATRGRYALGAAIAITTTYATFVKTTEKGRQFHYDFSESYEASKRIANLVLTVGGIAVDYGMHLRSEEAIRQRQSQDELLTQFNALQGRQETLAEKQWHAPTRREKQTIQQEIDLIRLEIEEVSLKLAQLYEHSPLTALHERSAKRLTEMCIANKGVYIKLGQHLAMLDYVVPIEYQRELTRLLSKNPHSDWELIERLLQQELGKPIQELFPSFDRVPIASASLAQVHVAYNHEGKKLAVKVQHPGLSRSSRYDRLVITCLSEVLSRIFPEFQYSWLIKEMNTNLPLELDFTNEVRNVDRCRANLQSLIAAGDVSVPYVHKQLSSAKVITMDFEDGVFVDEADKLALLGIHPSDIARTISRVFCEQMHGFVHCDPHPANLMIRKHPKQPNRPQLVLLDHGLYRELSDDFRRDYCRLWRSIICSDQENIKHYGHRLHAGEMFALLAAILTMRPWDDITANDINRLKGKNTTADKQMLNTNASRYFKEIVGLLGLVPSELLLLLKTNDCLRHLDNRLGAPINTATVIAEVASDVILREDIATASSWGSYWSIALSYLQVQLRATGLHAAEYMLATMTEEKK